MQIPLLSKAYPAAVDMLLSVGDMTRMAVAGAPRRLGTEVVEGESRPLIIVGGFMSSPDVYRHLAHSWEEAGVRGVTGMPLIRHGLVDIRWNADRLSRMVADTLRRTGADEVDLVGHSMGGLVVREFAKHRGGSAVTRNAITIGTPNLGISANHIWPTDISRRVADMTGIPSARQMIEGSGFLRFLNSPSATPAPTTYTSVASQIGKGSSDGLVPVDRVRIPAADNVINLLMPSRDSNHMTQVTRSDHVADAVIRTVDGRDASSIAGVTRVE